MNFKTVIDKIIEGGKLILTQPTFIFKDKEEVPFTEYEVRADDAGRIDLIAEDQYGADGGADIEYILKFNGISDPFSINEGDVLKIPVENSLIVKLERPDGAIDNIVRQSFIDGKKLTKKDQRRLDFLKKKYKIKEVLPPNMLKSGFSNSEIIKNADGTTTTKMGMGVGTPESNYSVKKTEKQSISDPVADSIADSIANKLQSNKSEKLTDAEIAKIENSGISSKDAIKLATTFDGTVIGSDVASTSNFSTNMSSALDENGNKIGNQSVNQSEQIEGDKVTKTVTKTIVKSDGSSETTQTVTFSKYEGK
tara:strand:+ start:2761 stop:3687 length:927 start_codon:yes stop_codon:yes gene_type:complete